MKAASSRSDTREPAVLSTDRSTMLQVAMEQLVTAACHSETAVKALPCGIVGFGSVWLAASSASLDAAVVVITSAAVWRQVWPSTAKGASLHAQPWSQLVAKG